MGIGFICLFGLHPLDSTAVIHSSGCAVVLHGSTSADGEAAFVSQHARLLKGEHHRRIAMADSKCKARGSGLRVPWDPLHAGVSQVHCDVHVTA